MAINKLSAAKVANAGDGMHSDGGGLYLAVNGTRRRWLFRYTASDGRRREMGLGPAANVGLKVARERAAQAREDLAEGRDPIRQRDLRRTAAAGVPTFADAAKRFIATRERGWRNAKHRQQWRATLETYAFPKIGQLPVDGIDAALVADVLMPIWTSKPETASRLRGRIERILGETIARRERPHPNPAAWRDNLEHIIPKQHIPVQHHAAVAVADAPEAFAKLWSKRHAGVGYMAVCAVILTATRSGEVRHLEWKDVEDDTITIPGGRMKAGRPHRIPVTPMLGELIDAQPRWSNSKLVFPGRSGKPASDMTLAMAVRRTLGDGNTVHGWRSTFREWAAAEGWASELAEDALAHTVGTAVERAYRRGDFLDRRRPMMAAWECYLRAAVQT